jgi:hypothetical protein
MKTHIRTCSAFTGSKRISRGSLREVALKAKAVLARDRWAQVLIFDDLTSEQIEVDFRGSAEDVLRRIPESATEDTPKAVCTEAGTRRPGRPKLGVVAREVTLLPRHWEWLAAQPGGASVALRKLVEQARKQGTGREQRRLALNAAYRFMSVMAGNEPGFEEATRALFAGKQQEFQKLTKAWPGDIRQHARELAWRAFAAAI